METITSEVIPPKSGLAVEVDNGQVLRVTDLEGKQVVDMAVFNRENLRETSSTANSRTRYIPRPGEPYAPRDHIEEGDYLMSTLCRPMMTIIKETVEPKGMHDANNRMCNRFLYEVFGVGPQDGCQEIITKAIEPYGLGGEDIPDTLDLFMNYPHNCEKGHFEILEPKSRAGDYIEFVAHMDCLVALSNCPEDVLTPCNGYECTPVRVDVYVDDHYGPTPVLAPDEWLRQELERRRSGADTGSDTG